MKIIWKECHYFTFFLVNIFCLVQSQLTDEEYGLMPNIFEVENYDACMLLNEKAFYCEINYELIPINPENPPKIWRAIKEYSASKLHYRHDRLRRYICVPKYCPNVKTLNKTNPNFRNELTECFNDHYKNQGFKGTIEVIDCKKAGRIYTIDIVDWIVALVFVSYILLVIALTIYDYFQSCDVDNYKNFKDTRGGTLTVAFSIISNWKKLKSIPSGPDFERLRPVQGLRVYMSIMVIAVHTALGQVAIPISNTKFFEDMNDSPDLISNIPKRAVFMLSFHFMMSSWILITSLLTKCDRNEVIDLKFIIKSIIKRYIRFILTIAVVVAFYATWFRHMPFGPFFGICDESDRCRKNWWTNLLFIQNHYDRYYMCHIITWYLAVDMHYYIIGLFLLMILLRKKISIPVTVCFLLIANFIFAFWDHKRHDYPSELTGHPEKIYKIKFNREAQWHDHFANYHANAAGYIVGLGFGYVYHKYKDQKIFTGLWKKVLWVILSGGLVGITILVPQVVDVDATTTYSALWVALTRPLFSLGMGIFILGLAEGLGGDQILGKSPANGSLIEKEVVKALRTFAPFIDVELIYFYINRVSSDAIGWAKNFLNWTPLYVLGKLSYCVYLCHVIFQNLRVAFMRSPGYVSYYSLLDLVASDVLLSFLGALFLSIFFEMPSNELANNMFGSKKKKTNKVE